MNLFGKMENGIVLWGSVAIAMLGTTLGMVTAALANPKANSVQIAQSNLCRAATLDTPIFESASTTSRALRILSKDAQVTLVAIPPGGVPFADIAPSGSGFVQTAVLKLCSSPPNDTPWTQLPTTGTACRRLLRPPAGVNVRRDPRTQSPLITTIYPSRYVVINLTTGGIAKSWRADGFDWVELDLPRSIGPGYSGTGWMYNRDLYNNPQGSNLGYCE